ncbi:unnamed protein product [Adineta ricciae]|uniref:Uncharacterized protein n=1 Tax=Adineta ricciae TaxID=249248 RepID=A0A813S1T4_ADIRI|nr:unnamed protein product [Adineta ricciae]
MLDPSDSPATSQPTSNLLFENVNKILTTFVPANHHHDSNQIHKAIGVKSHGTITFADNKSNRAEFIRVPPDASVMHVKELLIKQWCGKRPSLVISITGGAKDYHMKPKLLRAFRRGLSKVARTTGAWIITGGMNTGIMKLVGEIVQINPDRFRPIHLIGIATWGCVSGFQQLDVHGANVHYSKSRGEQKGEAPLEPNHTEFIFVDDGSERKYGREITFRARLEQAISGGFFATRPASSPSNPYASLTKTTSLRPEHSDPVPVVLLVVEGGPNTVRTVHEAVVQNNIPAVFFEGTGRCCDLFAKALHLYNEYHQQLELYEDTSNADPGTILRRYDEIKNKLREDLRDEIRGINGGIDPSIAGNARSARRGTVTTNDPVPPRVDNTDYFELVYECIDTRKIFLNIVSLTARNSVEPDIDLAILQALLNATSGSDLSKTSNQRKREQFHLALEWNRADIARHYIMKNTRDWDKINLNDMFEEALQRNQIEFVKLFLDHDFSLTDVFRNNDKLPLLYEHTLDEPYDFASISGDRLRAVYRDIIQPLIGDSFEVEAAIHSRRLSAYTRSDSQVDKEPCSCCVSSWTGRHYHVDTEAETSDNLRTDLLNGHTDSHMDVDKELFLWSVITGRREFNLLFWSRGKNKICAALFAALIYRKRARKTNDSSYSQSADEFENLAVQILDRFYQANTRACTKAIIRQIPAYGNVTWLDLAISAEAKQFIAQRAVQDVLNNIWFGYIDQRETHTAIIFSTVTIWYSGTLRYHDELVKTNDQTSYLDHSLRKSQVSQNKAQCTSRHSTERHDDGINLRLMHDIPLVDNIPIEFVDIGCCEKFRTKVFRYFRNILKFIRAPIVKYLYSLYFHIVFLFLFSYVILCDFFPLYEFQSDVCAPANEPERIFSQSSNQPNASVNTPTNELHKRDRPAISELILAGWIFTLLCEEIRQFFSTEAKTIRNAITAYFQTFWNQLDVIAIFLFYVAFALRFLPGSECFCAARIVLSVDLTLWFIRSLDIFAAVKRLGPKLVMIGEMAHDLKFFMLMLTVFILGFGVSSYSLLYGTKDFSWHLPREILNLAYWQMFGELNALDTFEHNYSPNGYAVFILLVIYMAIVSILLVNLLIAMFSNTFDRLQNDTDRIWKFQRYSLICEYLSRPSLPPPFIVFSHIWRLALYALSPCIRSTWLKEKYAQHTNRTKYKIMLDEKTATTIEIAEDALGDEVYYNYTKMGRKLVDESDIDDDRNQSPHENILNRIRILENRSQLLNNQQTQMLEYLDCLMDGLKALGGDRIRMPERRRFDPDDSFDELSGNNDQGKRYFRPDSLLDDGRRQSATNNEDMQLPLLNFFPIRRK